METKAGIRCAVLNVIDKDGGSVVQTASFVSKTERKIAKKQQHSITFSLSAAIWIVCFYIKKQQSEL